MTAAVTTVFDGFCFLESPRWHGNRLWFSDFYLHKVYSSRADGADLREEAEVPAQPSGLGWLPDGRLLIVSMKDRRVLRREPDGSLLTHGDLAGSATGHLNDLVVDGAGRVYVGNFGFDLMSGADVRPAPLHRIDPDGTVTEAAPELWFANGCALTGDGVLLVGETFGNRVSAFDVGVDGTLGPRRTWAEFGPLPRSGPLTGVLGGLSVAPDGCCLDAEGGLWIADATGSRLIRVVEGGTITDEIHPGTPVFACALGGPDGRTLYACAAPDFAEQARAAAREGRMIAVPVRIPGR